jgi:carboxyl-terminal processing protease
VTALSLTFSTGCISLLGLLNRDAEYVHPAGLDTGLLKEAWDIIFDNYVEPDKLNAEELNRGAISGMYEMMELENPDTDARHSTTKLDVILLRQAWDNMVNLVGKEKLIAARPEQGAIDGIVLALNDAHSWYLPPVDYEYEQQVLEGHYTGFGFDYYIDDEYPVVDFIIENSPAALAGLQVEDVILAINGVSTEGMDYDAFDDLLFDDTQSTFNFSIQRPEKVIPVELRVEKGEINIPSETHKMINDIAYIQLTDFSDDTPAEFKSALSDLNMKAASGIIIDLRDNPGGGFAPLMEIASYFFLSGTVDIRVDNKGQQEKDKVDDYWDYIREYEPDKVQPGGVDLIVKPLVILVNGDTASCSEALCGALQDYDLATIAGTVTYGKGSVNMFFDLRDSSAIYLTIERFLTPYGNEIEGKGITPDYILTQTGDDAVQWAVDYLHNNQN